MSVGTGYKIEMDKRDRLRVWVYCWGCYFEHLSIETKKNKKIIVQSQNKVHIKLIPNVSGMIVTTDET